MSPAKIFYDFEFAENGSIILPISLGLVAEDNNEIYLVNESFDPADANDWVRDNVLPYLYSVECKDTQTVPFAKMGSVVYEWLSQYIRDEDLGLIGYYADYDHVSLCQLWGRMIDLPPKIPMWTRDIKQWASDLGNPQLPETGKEGTEGNPHHGLVGARWNKSAYRWLVTNFDHPAWSGQYMQKSSCLA
jgi:hypothetical protein